MILGGKCTVTVCQNKIFIISSLHCTYILEMEYIEGMYISIILTCAFELGEHAVQMIDQISGAEPCSLAIVGLLGIHHEGLQSRLVC